VNAVPHSTRVARREAQRRRRRNRRLLTVVVLLVVLAFGGYAVYATGRVMPGVSVAGVDLGGRTQADAEAALGRQFALRMVRPIVVHAAGRTARVVPADLGIGIDVGASVDRAVAEDRLAGRLLPFLGSSDVAPVVRAPREVSLPKALRRALQAPRDATLTLSPSGRPTVVAARAGTGFDPAATSSAIVAAVFAGRTDVTLQPVSMPAVVSTRQAQAAAASVTRIGSRPVRLWASGERIGTLTGATLGALVRVRRTPTGFAVALDPGGLERALGPAQARLGRDPRNATWTTDGARATLVPARAGRGIGLGAAATAILAASESSSARAARRLVSTREPARTTEAARKLGISERIASATTSLGSSTPNRVHNVELMAQILDRTLVLPGDTFSFNDSVGERTAARGFLEGQEIVNGLLIPSIGGGVCQAASSVYDAALDGGYSITSRTNHSFYLSHYGMGLDATVSWGGPDFRFRNDSPYGILIRASADAETMTVNLYSTSRGYTTTLTAGTPTLPTKPGVRYVLDESLPPRASQQQTAGEGGFDVVLARVVRQRGVVVREDSFASHYTPEDRIFYVGRDFKVPAGHELESLPSDGT
jgi:vancomycin resistance protein YoaR